MDTASLYEAVGGDDGLRRLAEAWHARVMADDVVRHAFEHGYRVDHVERLAAYWAEALGGPPRYTTAYGDETAVVRMHSGGQPEEDFTRRAIACFEGALGDIGLDAGSTLRQALGAYFAWAATTTMGGYPDSAADVPEGLSIPRWSWDGLQG